MDAFHMIQNHQDRVTFQQCKKASESSLQLRRLKGACYMYINENKSQNVT